MGFMSDGARNAYRKAGGSAYVPEWYRSAIWLGVVIGVGGMFFAATLNDNDAPPSTYTTGNPADVGQPEGTVPSSRPIPGDTIELRGVDGSVYEVPQEAYDAAARAGLALWTGDWSAVPVTGELPDSAAVFPDARLGSARVVTVDADTVSLLFELDENGRGRVTQEFQVTVVSSSGEWAFPAFGG